MAVIPAASAVVPAASGVAAVVASKVQLLVSSAQLPSANGSTVTLTAIAVDINGQTMAGRPVVFSVPLTETATINGITPAGGITDVNGSVTATLSLGTNKTNRPITVTATVDGISATAIVNVTGTAVTVSGSTSVALNAATNLTFTVKDSAGLPISNQPVTISSLAGNTIVLVPVAGFILGTTDAMGVVTATVTAIRGGADTITATAAGATATSVLTVSADSFAFTNPTIIPIEIPLSPASSVVSVAWSNASGVIAAGTLVSFTSTRGTFAGVNPAPANAAGLASIAVQSTTAGPAIITATGANGTPSATLPVTFVATSANSIVAQANPATVQATTAGVVGQAGNTSVISVTVRDVANNLVKNATVRFNLTDPTGGILNAGTAVTDINGAASVTYTAGAATSPQNGVTISATVIDVNKVAVTPTLTTTNTVFLTVSGRTLFVRLGTDNIVVVDAVKKTNTITYAAIVTDSGGNPMLNQKVSFVLRPNTYSKGQFNIFTPIITPATATTAAVLGTPRWVQVVSTLTPCLNEDINFNGTNDLIDPFTNLISPLGIAEDSTLNGWGNGNGKMDPGGIASVILSAMTDLNGIALAPITYLRNYASWATVTLEATAGVVGTDPPTTATFGLPSLATDLANTLASPPEQISPFGIATACTNPN
ncbi:MAG: hypothetical protein WAO71_09855 [Gallionella sp.]